MGTDPEWFKSSYSDGPQGDCVEIADLEEDGVGVRDSKNPGHRLTVTRTVFGELIARVKDGQLDL